MIHKLRRARPRFGIRADRVRIQTHLPWYWYAVGGLLVVALVASGFWIYMRLSTEGINAAKMQELQAKVTELESEVTTLRSTSGTEEISLQMAKSMQQKLADKMHELESENTKLKEELAFYEKLGGVRKKH